MTQMASAYGAAATHREGMPSLRRVPLPLRNSAAGASGCGQVYFRQCTADIYQERPLGGTTRSGATLQWEVMQDDPRILPPLGNRLLNPEGECMRKQSAI